MKSVKGAQTEKNLLTAFAVESQVRNRYSFFASKAKAEGFVQIASLFEETADQEKEHAKRLLKFLEGGCLEITASFSAAPIGSTEANLLASADEERYDSAEMYPSFAAIADKEGFAEIAAVMRAIAVAEAWHEKRYRDFAANIREGRVFVRNTSVTWHCRNCGYIHDGLSAPEICPACAHARAHFELQRLNW